MVSYERKVGGFSTKKAKQKTLMFRVFTIKEFMSPPQWRLRAQITCVHIDSTLSLPVLVFYKIGSSDIWIIQHKKNLYKEKKNVCVLCVYILMIYMHWMYLHVCGHICEAVHVEAWDWCCEPSFITHCISTEAWSLAEPGAQEGQLG